MDRRDILGWGFSGAVVAAGCGGFLVARRAQARDALEAGLLDAAVPRLTAGFAADLGALPARARDDIRRYFHGLCLNVAPFVQYVCSDPFAERLSRCGGPDERDLCFLQAFTGRVAGEGEILGWVDAIATDIGRELDAAWTAYCLETSRLWNARVRGSGPPLTGDGLVDRVGGLVRAEIAAAAASAAGAGRRPALGTTIQTVGRSAVLLLPVLTAGPAGLAVGVPVFVLLAARPVWEYVAARLDDRRGDYRAAISARLAVLGNRVGAEFEREVRGRIADLHLWQERSVRATAARLADERAGGYL